jgi:preprotein translocase subunit YajC
MLIYIGIVSILVVWAYLIIYMLYAWKSARKQAQERQDPQGHIHRA